MIILGICTIECFELQNDRDKFLKVNSKAPFI